MMPLLCMADIGIAMGTGTDVAMEAGDITLMRGDLRTIPQPFACRGKPCVKSNKNLFWAFIYNNIGIPFAAFGMLNPVIAGAAISLQLGVCSN